MTTKNIHSSCRLTLTAAAVFSALSSLSPILLAEPMQTVPFYRTADTSRWSDNYVEIGGGYLSADTNTSKSYKFGEWSGLNEETMYGTLGFNFLSRNRQNDALYARIYGGNLGLDSHKFLLEGGRQGALTGSLAVERLTRSELDSAKFIHTGLGSNNLALPTGYAGTTQNFLTPPNAATANAALTSFDVKQQRDTYRLNLAAIISSAWDVKVNYREDKREGNRLTGALVNGGAAASILPYAMDDTTRQVETVLSYTSKLAQAQLAYTYSKYDNDLSGFSWQNPYTGNVNNPLGTENRMSLAPSNEYHQLSFTGALNLNKTTRLSTVLSQGIALQDAPFLSFTSNPLASLCTGLPANCALPRASLDGKVVTSLADLALTARPLDKMNLKLAYQYRHSDNKTPTAQYRNVFVDSTAQPASASTSIRTNVILETEEEKVVLDTDYEILPRTIARAALEHRTVDYARADIGTAKEDRGLLELRRAVSDTFTGALSYARKERRVNDYNKNQWYEASYTSPPLPATPASNTTNGALFTNNPQLRSFMYAAYDEDRLRLNGNWNATETISLNASIDGFQTKYQSSSCGDVAKDGNIAQVAQPWTNECLGRRKSEGSTANLDAQWQPEESLTTFAFYTYSQSTLNQIGRNWSTGAVNVADDITRDWTAKSTYRDHTVGLGSKWLPRDRWELGGQYAYSFGVGETVVALPNAASVVAGTATFVPTALPDTKSRTHAVQLYAKWNYSSRITLRANYLYENYFARDWSYDNLGATSTNGVLLTGQVTPRYINQFLGFSVALSTW